MVNDDQFLEDLFYRLNVIPIEIPPLRQRAEDIPALVDAFVHKHCRRAGKAITGLEAGAIDRLCEYQWPGNVRELENLIERTVVLSTDETIPLTLLAVSAKLAATGDGLPSLNLKRNVEWAEAETVRRALDAAGGVKKVAAEQLGLTPRALSHYLQKHGLG